jgi:hypothetical protein
MHKNQTNSRPLTPTALFLLVCLLLAPSIGGLAGCDRPSATSNTEIATPIAKDFIGLTEAELRAKYPEVTDLTHSFSILVSKYLYPYHPPATNKLLRFGRDYLVVELKDGRVIALHHVSG